MPGSVAPDLGQQLHSVALWAWLGVLAMVAAALAVGTLQEAARAWAPPEAQPSDTRTAAAHELDPLIARIGRAHMPPDWDWRLLKAMVRQESNYDPRAESPGGAVGLGQLLPATARDLGLTRGEFFDPAANLAAATRYLRRQHDRYHTVPDRAPDWARTRLAIASYNAGPGRVRQAVAAAGGTAWARVAEHLPDSTVHHVERIVDEFYPSFAAVTQDRERPAIGNWKPALRFWPRDG